MLKDAEPLAAPPFSASSPSYRLSPTLSTTMSSADGSQFKQEIYHDEKVFALDEAGQALRAEARSPWKVLRENARAVAVVLAVQVSPILVGSYSDLGH